MTDTSTTAKACRRPRTFKEVRSTHAHEVVQEVKRWAAEAGFRVDHIVEVITYERVDAEGK